MRQRINRPHSGSFRTGTIRSVFHSIYYDFSRYLFICRNPAWMLPAFRQMKEVSGFRSAIRLLYYRSGSFRRNSHCRSGSFRRNSLFRSDSFRRSSLFRSDSFRRSSLFRSDNCFRSGSFRLSVRNLLKAFVN